MSLNLPNLPIELQIEIFKKLDPETILNFCKKSNNKQTKSICTHLFKFILNNLKFTNLKSTFDYNIIYPDIYYSNIETFRNKNIILKNCFNESFIKSLLLHNSYLTISFLQSQNLKSICFDMSDNDNFFIASEDEEFENEATEIYKNSFLFSKCPLKRGDLIRFKTNYYPSTNDGKFIYDGQSLLSLDFEYNENGSCPKEFLVINEFPIKYFTESIINNSLVYSNISDVKLTQLKKDSFDAYSYILYSFYKNNKKYCLFAYSDTSDINIKLEDMLLKIKNENLYEAGIDPYIFDSDQINKIHKVIESFDISPDNILSSYIRDSDF